jgi:D-serine dehydratase
MEGPGDGEYASRLRSCEPLAWLNAAARPDLTPARLERLPLGRQQLEEARRRWAALRPLIAALFPAEATDGTIESPLLPLPQLTAAAAPLLLPPGALRGGGGAPPRLLLKLDSQLPVCGSVKARGGLYEVLTHAEDVARRAGWLAPGDGADALLRPEVQRQLARRRFKVVVGSTGNLGAPPAPCGLPAALCSAPGRPPPSNPRAHPPAPLPAQA